MATLLLVLLSALSAPQDRDAAARDLVEAWVAMWNAYDLEEVDRLFVPDESVTYFSSEYGGLIQGIGALREHHAGFGFRPGGAAEDTRLWLEDVEMRWAGEMAVVLAQWLFTRTDVDEAPQKGPVTFVLVPAEDGYRILHAHFASAPEDG